MTVKVPKEKLMSAKDRRELIERPLSIQTIGSNGRWGGTVCRPVYEDNRVVGRHTQMYNHDFYEKGE